MRFADQRAAALAERTPEPKCPGCPRPLEFIECPHGCGLHYLAPGQKLTAEQFWRYGPWRMSVHLVGRRPGSRCVKPLMDGPPDFTIPRLDDDDEDDNTTTEGESNGMGPQSN